jgi:hypothetical protein
MIRVKKPKHFGCYLSFLSILAFIVLLTESAFANDARCDTPPYGDSDVAFKAYANSFGTLAVRIGPAFAASKVLSDVCKAKFGGADRTRFYNLGFTEQDFRTKGVTDLAVQWITALKNTVDKLPDSAFKQAPEEDGSRIYALFHCVQSQGTCYLAVSNTFTTLAACQQTARYSAPKGPDAEGRFWWGDNQWFECRSKHVDTWESTR